MDRSGLIRTAATLIPLLLAWALWKWTKPPGPKMSGALLAFLWCFATLPVMNLFAIESGAWRFNAVGGLFLGQPMDLVIAWAVLWGVVPQWIPARWPSLVWALLFFWLDLLLMPKLSPVLQLGGTWLWVEGAAVLLVFLPAFYLGRWTAERACLKGRVILQFLNFVLLALVLVPLFLVDYQQRWDLLSPHWRPWQWSCGSQLLLFLALPGLSALQEFFERGRGTPFPFDPPEKMVSSGLYAYLANPMQTSMVLIYAATGILFALPWFLLGSAIVFAYGSGLARWHEDQKLSLRFGPTWSLYRREVRNWWPRWRPWIAQGPPARLYFAATCSVCHPIGAWFLKRRPTGLKILPMEDFPEADFSRLTYLDANGDYCAQGIKAFARGLEHLNFAWALAGAFLRLPIVSGFIQLLLDALGGGPRNISAKRLAPRRGPL
jgi:hypothetical protein